MIVLVNYSDDQMTKAQAICSLSAQKMGVDVVWQQNPETISDEFKEFNRDIFQDGARGAGCYWLFKPYVIYKAILKLKEEDILIYADAGVEFIQPVSEVINRMDEDIFFFTNTHPHYDWCKRKVLDDMFPDWVNYWKDRKPMPQVQASVMFFKVNNTTRNFVKEWLLWSQFPDFINDTPSVEGESEQQGFQEHRHDQAIITNIVYKKGYKLHWWPTSYSFHLERPKGDDYAALYNHHRRRNSEW